MKFLVPSYSCLQNPWIRGYRPQIPFLSVLCPQLNLLNPPPKKIPGYATGPRVFENRVLRGIFGGKRDEVTGEWRKLYTEELNYLYCSPSMFQVIKSGMKWTCHVECMGERRGTYRVLVGKYEGKSPFDISRCRWENNIKICRKLDVEAWSELIWLRIGTGGGHLWMRWWTFGFYKM